MYGEKKMSETDQRKEHGGEGGELYTSLRCEQLCDFDKTLSEERPKDCTECWKTCCLLPTGMAPVTMFAATRPERA